MNEEEPHWSPDGSRIAFTSDEGGHGVSGFIHVIDADGSNEIRLTTRGYSNHAAWSPDGKKIAFDGWRPGSSNSYEEARIFVMSANTESSTNPARALPGDVGHVYEFPDWQARP